MYHNVKKILLIFLLLIISKPSYAVFAGKVVVMEHTWPENALFDTFSFTQQVTYDGGPQSIYFWGNRFQFQNGKGGYIGLFNRGHRTVHFSIWNATGWKNGKCQHFTHEGSGVRCEIVFPWKTGIPYQLDVFKKDDLVTGTITDLISGKKTAIGTIEVPNTYGALQKSYSFVEDHSRWKRHLSSCYVLSPQSSVFFDPLAFKNGTLYAATLRSYLSGKCKDSYVIQTTCSFTFCMNSINDLGGFASPDAPKVPISNGKDLTAQTISTALQKEELVTILLKSGSWSPRIFLPSPDLFQWKSIFIDQRAINSSTVHTNHGTQKITAGKQIMYMSDGKTWKIMQTN